MSHGNRVRRGLRLLTVGAFVAVTACLVMVLEQAVLLLPGFMTNHPFELSIFGLVGLLAYARSYVSRYPHGEFAVFVRPVVGVVDPAIAWVMKGNRPTVVVSILIAALLLSWGPAYANLAVLDRP